MGYCEERGSILLVDRIIEVNYDLDIFVVFQGFFFHGSRG